MNIFGNNRSVGIPGPPGEDAFDLIRWLPDAVRRMFRETELITIYFDTAIDGIIYDDKTPNGLKNRGKGPPCLLVKGKPFPKIHQIKSSGSWMAELRDTLFKLKPVRTGTIGPSVTIYVMSFRAIEMSMEPRVIFSNEKGTRAISVVERKKGKTDVEGCLTIYASGSQKDIIFDWDDWGTLLLQYTVFDGVVNCQYILNSESGALEPSKQDDWDDITIYIGGHPTKKGALHSLAWFEMYHVEEGETLPPKMCELLVLGARQRVEP